MLVYAVDLMGKAFQIYVAGKSGEKEKDFEMRLNDQFLRKVVTASLEAGELDAANYAVRKMNSLVSKAEGLGRISKFNIGQRDLDAGRLAHDEAIKLMGKAESSAEVIAVLLKMLPTALEIDSSRLFELGQLVAKKINAIPTLNVDDKPDTKKYREYLALIMAVNDDLRLALTEMVKKNRNAAEDLGSRIDKKEIKITAEYVMSTDLIDNLAKPKRTADSAPLSPR